MNRVTVDELEAQLARSLEVLRRDQQLFLNLANRASLQRLAGLESTARAVDLARAEADDPDMRSMAETEARVQGDLERRLLAEIRQRLIDREEGATENLANAGLDAVPLFRKSDLGL